jgi:hypothetical protein
MTDRAPLPVETLGRLQKSLDSHRRRAERMGLPAHDIRVADLLAKSRTDSEGYYLCYETGVRLRFSVEAVGEDDKATIGHVFPMSAPDPNEMHPGHTLDNVELESWGNNQAQNHEQDTPFIARGKKMAVDFEREAKPSRWGNRKMQSPGFRKAPDNYVSPLSKHHKNYRKGKLG